MGQAVRLPGKSVDQSAALLKRRAKVIRQLIAGDRLCVVDRAFDMPKNSAKQYLRWLSPDQLETRAANMAKRAEKWRTIPSKVTQAMHAEIQARIATADTLSGIAADLGVTRTTIARHVAAIVKDAPSPPLCQCGAPRFHMGACAARFDPANFERRREAKRKRQTDRQRERVLASAAIRPSRDPIYARIASAMPSWLRGATRDDAISDVYLALCEGRITRNEIATKATAIAKKTAGRWESKYGDYSLDAMVGEDGDTSFLDLIPDASALEAFDHIRIGEYA